MPGATAAPSVALRRAAVGGGQQDGGAATTIGTRLGAFDGRTAARDGAVDAGTRSAEGWRMRTTLVSGIALILAGCLGQAGGGGPGGGGNGGGNGGVGGVQPPSTPSQLALLRLTDTEYNNTVRDLLNDTSAPASSFPADPRGTSGFSQSTDQVSPIHVSRYMNAAEQLAATAVGSLSQLAPCDTAAKGEDTCAQQLIDGFGRRAFRRHLTADEKSNLFALYKSVRGGMLAYGYNDAARVVIEAILQSPQFLYHWELGTPQKAGGDNGAVALSPDQAAARLSYFLWGSMPDDTLFAAVDAGQLASGGDIEKQARRLLADPRAADAVWRFASEWLEIDKLPSIAKDPTAYPTFNADLQTSMGQETRAFVKWAVLDDGHFDTLMTSSQSFINASLATLYGVKGVSGSSLTKVTLDPTQRMGILTQPSFLATQASTYESHPVKRGKEIWVHVACGAMAPPPMNVPPPGPLAPNLTNRQRFDAHAMNSCAKGCHDILDPPGFAFENYDGIGRWRTTDQGAAVDASGSTTLPKGTAVSFKNALDLIKGLSQADEVRRCFATQWLRFGLSRLETDGDQHALDSAYQTFQQSNYDIRELMVGIATSPQFLYRALAPGEVQQ